MYPKHWIRIREGSRDIWHVIENYYDSDEGLDGLTRCGIWFTDLDIIEVKDNDIWSYIDNFKEKKCKKCEKY
jgi:hypothetical protein